MYVIIYIINLLNIQRSANCKQEKSKNANQKLMMLIIHLYMLRSNFDL
jgi:hypothetical protein